MMAHDGKRPAIVEVGDGAAIPSKSDIGLFTAWRFAFFGATALLVYLAVSRPDPYQNILKFIPDGILVTFQVTVGSILLALVIGLVAGLGRISSNRLINGIASLYVEVTGTIKGKNAYDLLTVEAKYALTKDVKIGGAYYLINDDGAAAATTSNTTGDAPRSSRSVDLGQRQGDTNIIHTAGVNAEATLGPVTVDGFLLYQFGNLESPANRHVNAFAGNVGARGKIGPGTARTEFLYVSGDKGNTGTTNAFQSISDEHGFYNGNMQLLFRDAYAMTIDNAVVYTSNNKDQGVIAGFLGYDLPITSKLATSFNAGFAAAAKKNANTLNTSNGKYLGTEVNASVDYKLFDNMTASVRGAYVILGDYFDGVTTDGKDARDPYMGSVILNYVF